MAKTTLNQKTIIPKKTNFRKTGKFIILNKGNSPATFMLDGEIRDLLPKSKIVVDRKANSSHPHVKIMEQIEIVEESASVAAEPVSDKPKKVKA